MVVPIMSNKENNPSANIVPTITTSNVSDNVNRNISRNRDNDDDFTDTVKDVTLGDFNKFVRIQDTLEKSIERRNERHAPIESFGEKLGMKIEERMTDTMIDKMMAGMFNVGGTPATKTEGWVSILKTVLDSGFAQQAGSKLPETIDALTRNIGKQRMEELADATVAAIGPKKEQGIATSVMDEQKKMEKFVMGLSPVNIVDIKKFMELVNANPANGKITDINQAREILRQEQERIKRENPVLANEIAIENQDKDTGIRQPSPYGNSIDRMPGDMMDNMVPRDPGMMQNNQLSTEQILSLDTDNDMSVESFAWSQGFGNMLSEPNGLSKVRNILRRKQEELMTQLQGLGGTVGEPIEAGKEQPLETDVESGDMKWDNEDVGKKGVGKGRRIGDEDIVVPPHIADSPVVNNKEEITKESQIAQNNILELLQKMAQNFDSGMIDINQKLQAVEHRVAKVESVNSVVPNVVTDTVVPTPENIVSDITVNEENIRAIMDTEFEEEKTEDVYAKEEVTEEDNVSEEKEDIVQETVEKDEKVDDWGLPISEIKEETVENAEMSNSVHKKAPNSIIDEPKETSNVKLVGIEDTKKSYTKGSQGWLKEQQKKKALVHKI